MPATKLLPARKGGRSKVRTDSRPEPSYGLRAISPAGYIHKVPLPPISSAGLARRLADATQAFLIDPCPDRHRDAPNWARVLRDDLLLDGSDPALCVMLVVALPVPGPGETRSRVLAVVEELGELAAEVERDLPAHSAGPLAQALRRTAEVILGETPIW